MKTTNTCSRLLALTGAIALGGLVAIPGNTVHAAIVTYSDGDFSTNWSVAQVGATGGVSATRVAFGGNPGIYWQVTNDVATTDLEAISLRSDFTFNPFFSGVILDLSVSYDAITRINNQGQGTAPALLQNGVLYGVLPQDTGYYTSYQSLSFANLTANSFVATDGSNTHPDFTAGGSTITLGFLNSNTGTGQYSNRTTQSDYDNFFVTVDYVPAPEPSTWAALTAGAGLLSFRLRRRIRTHEN